MARDREPTQEPAGPARLTVEAHVPRRPGQYLDYYEARSRTNQHWYRRLKIVQLVAAALIPVVASLNASGWVTGGHGSLVVVVEGVQQLYQFQEHWLACHSTAEALRREQHLYQTVLATTPPVATLPGSWPNRWTPSSARSMPVRPPPRGLTPAALNSSLTAARQAQRPLRSV